MAKAAKGCVNEKCTSRIKKTIYSDKLNFCPLCGSSLLYVCRGCWMQLADSSSKYCIRCEGKRKDARDEIGKTILNKAAGTYRGIAEGVGKIGKKDKNDASQKSLDTPQQAYLVKSRRIKVFGAGDVIIPGKFERQLSGELLNNKRITGDDIFTVTENGINSSFSTSFSLSSDQQSSDSGMIDSESMEITSGNTSAGYPFEYDIIEKSTPDAVARYECKLSISMKKGILHIDAIFETDSSEKSGDEAWLQLKDFLKFMIENN